MSGFLTAAQIISLACNIAKCPGYASPTGASIAGAIFNEILEEMYNDYDFEINRGIYNFTFNSGAGTGAGPYAMPAAFLRTAKDGVFYTVSNVPYKPIPLSLSEYDSLDKDPSMGGYPEFYTSDMSTSPPGLYFWPIPQGSYSCSVRYYGSQSAISNPETSASIPWFPSSSYLKTRLAGELMQVTDDKRAAQYLGDGSDQNRGRARILLDKVLEMKDDPENVQKTVRLDRRRFADRLTGTSVPNTKTIGF